MVEAKKKTEPNGRKQKNSHPPSSATPATPHPVHQALVPNGKNGKIPCFNFSFSFRLFFFSFFSKHTQKTKKVKSTRRKIFAQYRPPTPTQLLNNRFFFRNVSNSSAVFFFVDSSCRCCSCCCLFGLASGFYFSTNPTPLGTTGHTQWFRDAIPIPPFPLPLPKKYPLTPSYFFFDRTSSSSSFPL